jgi:hypothetical protein
MLTGTAVKNAEAVIKIDDKLVSNVFVADIDEAKNHWDVRSPYSAEMGNALAYTFDRNIAAQIAKAARTATNFNTDLPGGTRIKIVAATKAAITGAQLATACSPLLSGWTRTTCPTWIATASWPLPSTTSSFRPPT